MPINYYKNVLFSMFLLLISIAGYSKTTVSALKCEYKINPIGIGVAQPRLSWQIVSPENHFMQQAYEIRVAESQGNLSGTSKLLWGTGKVNSSESVNITYGGPSGKSMQRMWWQVRIWDTKNKATSWSEPAYWEMGLLGEADWKASWIRLGEEQDNLVSRPSQYFRKEFSLSKKVKSARVYVTALGLYELRLNGKKVGNDLFTPGWTSYKNRIQYQTYDVTTMLSAKNAIGAIVGDGWYRGNIGFNGQRSYYGDKSALLAQLEVNYTDGTRETITTDSNWKVTTGPILESDIYNGERYDARLELNGWDQAGYADSKWKSAKGYDFTKSTLISSPGSSGAGHSGDQTG